MHPQKLHNDCQSDYIHIRFRTWVAREVHSSSPYRTQIQPVRRTRIVKLMRNVASSDEISDVKKDLSLHQNPVRYADTQV